MYAPIMKRISVSTLLVSLAVLCGCAHQYLMKINNGDELISLSRPKLQGTNYFFRDDMGQHVIPQSRVVKIVPVSVVNEQGTPPSPAKPNKPRHWYFLWLA